MLCHLSYPLEVAKVEGLRDSIHRKRAISTLTVKEGRWLRQIADFVLDPR
jgi:hypothetical protein